MPHCLLSLRDGVFVLGAVFLPYLLSVARAAPRADIAGATALYKSGQYVQCARICGQAIENRQYSETWRVLKIRSELATGHYEEALATLESAFKHFPSSVRLRWLGHQVYLLHDEPERAATVLDQIDDLVERARWRYRDPSSRIVLGHFYLHRGVDARQVLQATFNQVKRDDPDYADAYLGAGQVALEKHDYELAAEELLKAAKLDAANPDVFFALARAYAASERETSIRYLETALARNPHHVDSLLLVVDEHIDAERYAEAEKILLHVFGVNPLHPRAWAYRAVLSHLHNRATDEELSRRFALTWWEKNPEVDYLIGKKLSQKYRFAEGAAYQRQSLAHDPGYLPAKMQLGQDLLRLGEESDGWRLATEVYDADGYNVVAHNLVTLQEYLTEFRVLESDGLIVRMDAREADIYGRRALELLRRAKLELCAKYDVELPQDVIIEIFPRPEDFEIRTFGLPGGEGFLGVCFGRVVTANSPASRGDSPANWESVLWHEFCHVVTLHKTHNKMPRWLSEGISVFEETQANATWGQSWTPQYREMVLGGELVPVSELSGAFLHPPSPQHLQFAYFESALVVEYLVEQYGLDVLKKILVDLGVGMPANESLRRYTGSLAALDREFAVFAEQQAKSIAPGVDWRKPPLPPEVDAQAWAAWIQAHPNNYWGLQNYAKRLLSDGNWQAAKQPLTKMRELYPEFDGPDNAYALLAAVHRELGEADEERSVLSEWVTRSDDAVAGYQRLMELGEAAEDWQAVLQNAERMLAVNPLVPAPHRFATRAAERLGDEARAIESLQALLHMDPLDLADIHYRLAVLLQRSGSLPDARRHVLKALEEAPRFRAAHQTLLEIVRQTEEPEQARD